MNAQQTTVSVVDAGFDMYWFRGDINGYYQKAGGGMHIGFSKIVNQRFNSRLCVNLGQINVSAKNYVYEDESGVFHYPEGVIQTKLLGIHYQLNYNFIRTERWAAYAKLGLGIYNFRPFDSKGMALTDRKGSRDFSEEYANTTFQFPMGLGVRYLLPSGFGWGMEWSLWNPQTDYTDNISLWSTYSKRDNIQTLNFSFFIPLKSRVDVKPFFELENYIK